MKCKYTLITLEEAVKILQLNRRTVFNYISSKRIPPDWYYKNKLGQYWFKLEKIQGIA